MRGEGGGYALENRGDYESLSEICAFVSLEGALLQGDQSVDC